MTNQSNTASTLNRPTGGSATSAGAAMSRAGALAGLAGAVFYVVGSLLPGSPPKPDAGPSQVITFFVEKRETLLSGFALELIALVLLLCFLGQLRTVVATTGRTAAPLATAMTAAWVVLMTTVAVATLPAITLVWQSASSVDPSLVRMAYGMEILGTYAVSSAAAAVSIAVPSIVIWRSRVLPRWLVVLGGAEVVGNVVELSGLFSRHGILAGGYTGGVGSLLWALWVSAASVCIARRSSGDTSVVTAAPVSAPV